MHDHDPRPHHQYFQRQVWPPNRAACMIGVPAYRLAKTASCVSQLEARGSRLGAVIDRREVSHAASFDLRNEVSRSLCHGGMGDLVGDRRHARFQAPRSRSTLAAMGDRPPNHRLISARYRAVMHPACGP
jgi:hypothetical protein